MTKREAIDLMKSWLRAKGLDPDAYDRIYIRIPGPNVTLYLDRPSNVWRRGVPHDLTTTLEPHEAPAVLVRQVIDTVTP